MRAHSWPGCSTHPANRAGGRTPQVCAGRGGMHPGLRGAAGGCVQDAGGAASAAGLGPAGEVQRRATAGSRRGCRGSKRSTCMHANFVSPASLRQHLFASLHRPASHLRDKYDEIQQTPDGEAARPTGRSGVFVFSTMRSQKRWAWSSRRACQRCPAMSICRRPPRLPPNAPSAIARPPRRQEGCKHHSCVFADRTIATTELCARLPASYTLRLQPGLLMRCSWAEPVASRAQDIFRQAAGPWTRLSFVYTNLNGYKGSRIIGPRHRSRGTGLRGACVPDQARGRLHLGWSIEDRGRFLKAAAAEGRGHRQLPPPRQRKDRQQALYNADAARYEEAEAAAALEAKWGVGGLIDWSRLSGRRVAGLIYSFLIPNASVHILPPGVAGTHLRYITPLLGRLRNWLRPSCEGHTCTTQIYGWPIYRQRRRRLGRSTDITSIPANVSLLKC